MNIIEVNSISKRFGRIVALKDISLNIEEKQIFGIIGPDGAGKTTFLRILSGILLPDTGIVKMFGKDIYKEKEEIKRRIGVVPQQFTLYYDLTVYENLRFFQKIYDVPEIEFREKIKNLLEITGLENFKNRMAGKLSGGMQKKLALITALLHSPSILILDEPTTGIDPVSRREMWNFFYELSNRQTTIVISTPYLDEIEKCNYIGFLYKGEFIFLGNLEEIYQKFPYIVLESSIYTDKYNEIIDIYQKGDKYYIICDRESKKILVKNLSKDGISVKEIKPSIDDIFFYYMGKKYELH